MTPIRVKQKDDSLGKGVIACSNGLTTISHLSKRKQIITGIQLIVIGVFISI